MSHSDRVGLWNLPKTVRNIMKWDAKKEIAPLATNDLMRKFLLTTPPAWVSYAILILTAVALLISIIDLFPCSFTISLALSILSVFR